MATQGLCLDHFAICFELGTYPHVDAPVLLGLLQNDKISNILVFDSSNVTSQRSVERVNSVTRYILVHPHPCHFIH